MFNKECFREVKLEEAQRAGESVPQRRMTTMRMHGALTFISQAQSLSLTSRSSVHLPPGHVLGVITDYHALNAQSENNTGLFPDSSGDQKSKTSLSRLKSRCY